MGRLARATAAIASLACACSRTPAPPAMEPVTIAVSTNPHFGLVHLALAKGFFAAEGLEVTARSHPFGKPALEDVLAGRADLATCAVTPIVYAALGGRHVSVLAATGSSSRTNVVLADRAAGISGPADLSGKRIGVPVGTSGEYFLATFLLRVSLATPPRVVDLKPEQMADALASRAVDAVAIWAPASLALQRRFADRLVAFYERDLFSDVSLLAARRGFAQERPEAARRVLRALLRAEQLLREQPEEALREIARRLAGPEGDLAESVRLFQYGLRLDQSLLVVMEEEARWLRESGRAPGAPQASFLDLLEPGPLAAVRSAAVRLVR